MAEVVRVGVDLVLVSRAAALAAERSVLARLFQPAELADTRPEHLAGLLAAKEACFKALGSPARWHDVEVRPAPDGRPALVLAESARPPGLSAVDLSIAHEGGFAVAVVVAVLRPVDGGAPDG